MKSLAKELHQTFFNDKLQITLSELSEACGVSPSQIRYWEKKGYIQSTQNKKNQSHKYTFKALSVVMGIKYYLDQGYTLSTAFTKQQQQRNIIRCVKSFAVNRIQDIKLNGQLVEIDLGPLKDEPLKHVVAMVESNGDTKLELKSAEN
ncbi:MerR family transcriptional regulator [uncultured Limosilactobacillus sp.]|uniref:MerR family transcriptional regulator n=1 Tax=uncultured Limosilactobacillus sp. TaxID=2837629 RepID=UPI0025F2BA03|nr:MerR family transcriptional regulator [uncultured Limosilactobacillus sp.]